MHRIDTTYATVDELFTEGNPSSGDPATRISAAWLNDLQEEICSLIEAAGLTLVKGTRNQLAAAIRAPAFARFVSVKDPEFGAVGDGIADDTAAIQAAINAAYAVYFPASTYRITGDGVQAKSKSFVFGDGAASILKKSADSNAYVLYASGKSDITIQSIACDGSRSYTNDYSNSKFGIYLNDCDNCLVQACHVYGCLADGIVIEYGKDNRVIANHVYNNNKVGIYASGAEDVTIVGNTCNGNGSNSTAGGIAVSATWGATVGNNVCSDSVQFDIALSRGSRFCNVIGNTGGAHLTGQAPLSIYVLGEPMGGTLHGVNYGDGSMYYGASDCIIACNNFSAEMRLELLADSVVAKNNINGSNDAGIWVYGCTRVSVDSNKVSEYTNTGILVSASAKNGTTQSTQCHIVDNHIYKSGGTASTAISKSGTDNIYQLNTLNSQPLESGGAWTPSISTDGTAPVLTYSEQIGAYAFVGDLVFVRARVTVNTLSSAGTGNIVIAGWPFQSLIKEQVFLTVSRFQQTQNAITAYALGLGVSASNAYFYYTPTTTGNASFLSAADGLKAGFSFMVSGCYRIGAA